MTFIDLDGVLADLEEWCLKIDSHSLDNPECFNKFAAKHYEKLFLESNVIDKNLDIFDKWKNRGFRILTALPNLNNFICNNIQEYELETLLNMHRRFKENKLEWLYKNLNIQPSHVLCVNNSSEKYLYCKSIEDILYDDYKPNIEDWKKVGGNAIHVEYIHK